MLSELYLPVILMAFFLAFIDTTLGMGYGTTISPLLLILGFPPLEIIPAVLLVNIFMGLTSGFLHHKFRNVDFSYESKDLKIMILLVGFGVLGISAASFIAVRVPEEVLIVYIGLIVFFIGIRILLSQPKDYKFSWIKMIGLGLLAAFNKGMSGGGYGPVVVGGQILSGVRIKNSIGIAVLAEGLVSITGLISYLYLSEKVFLNIWLCVSLFLGSIASLPFSAYSVQKIDHNKLRKLIGIASILIGIITFYKFFV